jgi:type I restriction enzyme S subunit
MRKQWLKVRLGDVLKPAGRGEVVDAARQYRLLGVRLDGQGPFLRETVSGAQTSATRLYRVAQGDFIYSRLFASRGAFGVIGEELDGCYVSGEFPTFVPIGDRIDVAFLQYWFHLPPTIARVNEDCTGSTPLTRNRFREHFFLALEIPLPPLDEQRRLVAQIEDLAGQIGHARALRQQSSEEADLLLKAVRRAALADVADEPVELAEVCSDVIDNLHSNPRYAEAGVPCVRSPDVGWGSLNLDAALRTDEAEYCRRTVRGEPQRDDIVFVREGGGTGKCALVSSGQRFSLGQRVMMLRPNPARVLPRFLLHQLLSPVVQEDQVVPLCKGSASPHLNIAALKRFSLRVPPLDAQSQIVAHLDAVQVKVDALKALQADTTADLGALHAAIIDRAFKGELV